MAHRRLDRMLFAVYNQIRLRPERSAERSDQPQDDKWLASSTHKYTGKCKKMAGFVPVPGVMSASIRFILDSQLIENVLNFRYDDASFPAASSEVWFILDTVFWPALYPSLSVDLVNSETYFADQSDAAGPVYTAPAFTHAAGGLASESMPNSIALCVSHRTANRGRSYRGRTFVPGLPESSVLHNTVIPAAVSSIVGAFEDMRAACDAAGLPLVVVSRRHNNAPRVEGIATVVTACVTVDPTVDSQRRRLPGRGR
jgi:hypothetical protein